MKRRIRSVATSVWIGMAAMSAAHGCATHQEPETANEGAAATATRANTESESDPASELFPMPRKERRLERVRDLEVSPMARAELAALRREVIALAELENRDATPRELRAQSDAMRAQSDRALRALSPRARAALRKQHVSVVDFAGVVQ